MSAERPTLDDLESLTDAQIRNRRIWRQRHPLDKSYARGIPQEHQQTDLNLGRTDTEFRDLPQHPDNISQITIGPTQEQLDASEKYIFTPQRKGMHHHKQTIHATDYKRGVNNILKTRGINPYEWEPYPNFVTVSPEELDYLQNVQKLFPEHYAQTFNHN